MLISKKCPGETEVAGQGIRLGEPVQRRLIALNQAYILGILFQVLRWMNHQNFGI